MYVTIILGHVYVLYEYNCLSYMLLVAASCRQPRLLQTLDQIRARCILSHPVDCCLTLKTGSSHAMQPER